jgi:hypothetical protein
MGAEVCPLIPPAKKGGNKRTVHSLTHRLHNACLGDPAEIAAHGRHPARRGHVERDRLGQHVGMGQRLWPTVVRLMHAVDAECDTVREQRLAVQCIPPGGAAWDRRFMPPIVSRYAA